MKTLTLMISAQQKGIFIIGLLWILEKKILDQRSKILDELLEKFSREYTFKICKYTSTKEEDVEPSLWESFLVKMTYEKIGCDKTELQEQLRSAWSVLNTL